MLVSELIEWLKTQDQDAVVQVLEHTRGKGYYDQGGITRVIEFNPRSGEYCPDHWDYIDLRGNKFVKETDEEYNMRYLLLGSGE